MDFPLKRVGAGVIIRGDSDSVLLVEPTYEENWEIPGGLVEVGESPIEAARRECLEELGVEIDVGRLLCVHYVPALRHATDGVMFVFDGGADPALNLDRFALEADEIRSARFVAEPDLHTFVSDGMRRRIGAALAAVAHGTSTYLER